MPEREQRYEYSQGQIDWLMDRDPLLAGAIKRIGPIRRKIYPEPFAALLRAVIGQQISSKAQDSIWQRFYERFAPLSPARIAAVGPDTIRACGISLRKAHYLSGIAAAFANGDLDAAQMRAMADQTLADALMRLPGVGKWTAEMLLIFTFQRPDVLSFGDLAIRRGMMRLYGHKEITREIFAGHHARYSPNATLAGMYLWEIASEKMPPAA